jgi:Uma2 family endonuclease
MTTRTEPYLDAIEHLPEGGTLVLQNVPWDDYESLLEDLAERPRFRVTFDRGKLEIMSPLSEHDSMARMLDRLVHIYAEQRNLELDNYGSTTWKRRSLARGLEADSCYYVANARRMIGRSREASLDIDPPPDICVEIDITNESLSKFSIYAALGVPELWRFESKAAHFYELAGDSYREVMESRFLPGLSPQMLVDALEQSARDGQTAALRAFRARVR